MQHIWAELGLTEAPADERAVKRAYAARLRTVHPEDDAAGFQKLRQAYEHALAWARWRATHPEQDGDDDAGDDDQGPDPQGVADADAVAAGSGAADDAAPVSEPVSAAVRSDQQAGVDAANAVLKLLYETGEDAACGQFQALLGDERMISLDTRYTFEDYLRWQLVRLWPTPIPEKLLAQFDKRFGWSQNDALMREQPRLRLYLRAAEVRDELRLMAPRQRRHNAERAGVIDLLVGPWSEEKFAAHAQQKDGLLWIDLVVTDLISDHRDIPLEWITSKEFVEWWTGKMGRPLKPRPYVRPQFEAKPQPADKVKGIPPGMWVFIIILLFNALRFCADQDRHAYRYENPRPEVAESDDPHTTLSATAAKARLRAMLSEAGADCDVLMRRSDTLGPTQCLERLQLLRLGQRPSKSEYSYDPADAEIVADALASAGKAREQEVLSAARGCIRLVALGKGGGGNCDPWNRLATPATMQSWKTRSNGGTLSFTDAQQRIRHMIELAAQRCQSESAAARRVLPYGLDCAQREKRLSDAGAPHAYTYNPADAEVLVNVAAWQGILRQNEILTAVSECIRREILQDGSCANWNALAALNEKPGAPSAVPKPPSSAPVAAPAAAAPGPQPYSTPPPRSASPGMSAAQAQQRIDQLLEGAKAECELALPPEGSSGVLASCDDRVGAIRNPQARHGFRFSPVDGDVVANVIAARGAPLQERILKAMEKCIRAELQRDPDGCGTWNLFAGLEFDLPEEAGSAGRNSRQTDREIAGWVRQVQAQVQQHWHYTGDATGLVGKIRIKLAADGRMMESQLESSGDAAFDQSLKDAVAQAGAFPAFPSVAAYKAFRDGGGAALVFRR